MVRLIAAAFVLLSVACTTVVEEPNNLDSFKVTFSAGETFDTGTKDSPAPYISGTSCDVAACPNNETCVGFCSLTGAPCEMDSDCLDNDYCEKICARPAWIDIEALGIDGEPVSLKKDRWVRLAVEPGMVPPPFRYAKLTKGKASQVMLYISRATGPSHIWVEDAGEGPMAEKYGECNNNIDDDGDGFIDMADHHCTGPEDPTEAAATYATGLSPTLYYQHPTTWHLQYSGPLVATSPLEGQNVRVDTGSLVVTNVVSNGFYVTDLDYMLDELPNGLPGYYNSMFLYTFNKPSDVNFGDTLCYYSGGVIEYQGNTQMTNPSFEVMSQGKCVSRPDFSGALKVPEPIDITDLVVPEDPSAADFKTALTANALALEPFESSLVKLRNVAVSTRYVACDSDMDGEYPSGSDDALCRNECQNDPYCTQLESFFQYSQLAAYAEKEPVQGSSKIPGKKIYVGLEMLKKNKPLSIPFIGAKDQTGNCPDIVDVTTGAVVTENPHRVQIGQTYFTEYACPGLFLNSVAGTMRHIYFCSKTPGRREGCTLQMHMVVPRFDSDFDLAK